ncbi:MAG: ATP-binding protein, partial [Planctomycetota bacterium]
MNKIIVLEDQFDPYELPPGYYTAYSDTAAYPTLWSMVNVGIAHDEGSRYLEGGVIQMMASYDMPPLERNPEDDNYEEAMIVIPHSSFTKVTNDYGNWRQMWWREVIQNAVDAGATQIDCRIQELEDGTWLASCQDNGEGMSQDTMMNAFFTVGGTEKPAYAHGGFGEAKKLIALAWIQFSVHSRDVLVQGSGAEFPKLKLYRNAGTVEGTKVEVVMPADKHTTEAAAIEYISRCQLSNVRFFVNGTVVRANLRRGRKKRDLPDGAELFYNKNVEGLHT